MPLSQPPSAPPQLRQQPQQQPQPPAPPLLLTKRLIYFLHTRLSPTLTTAFICTPNGKLLAHASIDPTSTIATLRTRATVAALLWDIQNSGSSAASAATGVGGSNIGGYNNDRNRSNAHHQRQTSGTSTSSSTTGGGGSAAGKPTTITVQLEKSVVVVRRLRCGILFVAMGPIEPVYPIPSRTGVASASVSAETSGNVNGSGKDVAATRPPAVGTAMGMGEDSQLPTPTIQEPPKFPASDPGSEFSAQPSSSQPQHQPPSVTSTPAMPTTTPAAPAGAAATATPPSGTASYATPPSASHLAVGSPSADSIISAGASSVASAGAQGAVGLRRTAEEVAGLLDGKLGSLRVPGERIGVEFW